LNTKLNDARYGPIVYEKLIAFRDSFVWDKKGETTFKLAIRAGQNGLAYLILDKGFDIIQSIREAMDEFKIDLVLSLLPKFTTEIIVKELLSILYGKPTQLNFDQLKKIFLALKEHGVNNSSKDKFGRTVLHYAVLSNRLEFVKLLLTPEEAYDTNEKDLQGFTPFTLYVSNESNISK